MGYSLIKTGRYGTSKVEYWTDRLKRGEYYEILESRDIRLEAARKDPFSVVRYFKSGGMFGQKELYDLTPFSATAVYLSPQAEDKPFRLKYISHEEVEITPPHAEHPPKIVKLGEIAVWPEAKILIQAIPTNTQSAIGSEFEFQFQSEFQLFQLFKGGFVIQSWRNTPEKITVYFTDPIPQRTTRFLENMMEVVERTVRQKAILPLQRSVGFFDEQIRQMELTMANDSLIYRQRLSGISSEMKDIQNRLWLQTQNEANLEKELEKQRMLQQLELKILEPQKYVAEYNSDPTDSLDRLLIDALTRKEDFSKELARVSFATTEQIRKLERIIELEDHHIHARLQYNMDLLKVNGSNEPITMRAIERWLDLIELKEERLEAIRAMIEVNPGLSVTERPFLQKLSYPAVTGILKYMCMVLALMAAALIIIPVFHRKITTMAQLQLAVNIPLLGNITRSNRSSAGKLKGELLLNLTGSKVAFISLGSEARLIRETVEEIGKEWIPDLACRAWEEIGSKKPEATSPHWFFLTELDSNAQFLLFLGEMDQIVITYNARRTLRSDIEYLEGLLENHYAEKGIFAIAGEWK